MDIVSTAMKKMIKYFDGDVKRINHALKYTEQQFCMILGLRKVKVNTCHLLESIRR